MPTIEFVKIVPADDHDKYKFYAIFRKLNQKTSPTLIRRGFGARGYEDYTMHRDKERRRRYRIRHDKDLRTGDPTRAGFLSYYILWGDSTSLQKNVQAYRRHFFP
jgi:hypothetical protein